MKNKILFFFSSKVNILYYFSLKKSFVFPALSYLCGLGRILSIDYGTKRTGIAVTDPLQIIASGLTTVHTGELWEWLTKYISEESVERIVLGEPLHHDDKPAQFHHLVVGFSRKIKKSFPEIEVVLWDERFTSQAAKQAILMSGAKKKKRRQKELVDKMSATLILQDYMENNVW
jgi:putative Holliday junction resolvase